jgi:hypothetical protein
MSGRAQLAEARELSYDHSYERRHALGRILRPRADTIQDHTLGQAYHATNFLGQGTVASKRWAAITSGVMQTCLDALEAADPERTGLLCQARSFIYELRAVGFPRVALKALVGLGFRLALHDVKAHAREVGFDPEELEDELRVFQRAFEARIIYPT